MNSDVMMNIRSSMLSGEPQALCSSCYYEDKNNKVSGRSRQLLKSGIQLNNFDKTFCSSPHWELFEESFYNQGYSKKTLVDLQIDLGNTCNSACIMCSPQYSSRLATEYIQLNQIQPYLFELPQASTNWADDPNLVNKVVNELSQLKDLKYVHFLGGETLYLKSFYSICNKLIELGLSKNITIGTTTNCTVYTPELEYIIRNFKQVHLGLSVEAIHKINDYVRYPSQINDVQDILEKFLSLRQTTGLQISLRITPNALTIFHLDTLFDFMISHKVIAESCNILQEPKCLRIEILPKELLEAALKKINTLILKYNLKKPQLVINQRREDLVDTVISQVIFEYQTLLSNQYNLPNVEYHRYNLIKFLKTFETVRNNNILNYLPEYEEFLRSYNY